MSTPASNSSVIEPEPWSAYERISLTPSMLRSSCSMGLTRRRSASSGEIPSWGTAT